MEFIKAGKNYMIKNGNGRIITEKEKLEQEKYYLLNIYAQLNYNS